MASQQQLLRIFRLIRLLNTSPYKSVPQLSKILDTTTRSVYRYLDFLQEVGYLVDKDENNRYFIIHQADQQRDQLLDAEEAYFVQDMVQQMAPNHPLSAHILAKLNKIHRQIPAADNLPNIQAFQNVKLLSEAIHSAQRVWLKNYHSASSQKVSDRYVEPIHFDEAYTYLLAFDLNAQENRQFKVDRIGKVEPSSEKITGNHEAVPLDVFGFSGETWLPVRLELSARAYRLLIEDFPGARPFIEKQEKSYYFIGQVRDWRGISRFVLGLPGEVKNISPKELTTFLQKEIQRFDW